uniref:Transposase, Ptta/En/Spm, plant n=1 Tax=Ananas comosus var. bracteatus TaxID=296719 RepID=A0A6V7QJL4_ANACO|nr:unnamed protein product [Ananas comosus var. bracteatus]
MRSAPISPSGTEILKQLEGICYRYGKGLNSSKKRTREEVGNLAEQVQVEAANQIRVFEDADDFIRDDHNDVGKDSGTLDSSTQCFNIMARSKRLRECEITSLRQDPRSNSTESEFDTESDSEPSSEPDSQSQSQIQEQANVGYDEIVESKFSVPSKECVNAWILKSVSRKWKGYKYELKAKYKVNDQTEQQIASTVPNEIMPQQWIDLVRIWFSEKSEEKCMTEVAKRSVSSESPDAIFQLENEVFGKLIGKEQYGRVRGYGLGPSPTQVFGPQAQFRFMDNAEQNSVELQSQMKTMQNNYESKLAEMQQNYDTKLAEMQQDFQSQLNQVASMLQIFARSSNNLGGVASQFPDFARSSDSGNAGENPAPDIWFT